MSLAEENGINYVLMDATNGEEAFSIVTKAFSENEPMSKHLEATLADSEAQFRPFWNDWVQSGLSLVAIDTESNKVIGALTAWDSAIIDNLGCCQMCNLMCCILPSMPALLAPMNHVAEHLPEEKLDALVKEFGKGRADLGVRAELVALAVDPAFGGKGIGGKLIQLSYDLMKQKGFLFSYAECGCVYSEKAIVKHGGKIEANWDYATFEFEGAKPFETMAMPHTGVSLVVTRF